MSNFQDNQSISEYELTLHAMQRLKSKGRSQIKEQWIKDTLKSPDHKEIDERTGTIKVWKRIPEYGDRALRVIYNPNTQPKRVVTMFFDRGFRK